MRIALNEGLFKHKAQSNVSKFETGKVLRSISVSAKLKENGQIGCLCQHGYSRIKRMSSYQAYECLHVKKIGNNLKFAFNDEATLVSQKKKVGRTCKTKLRKGMLLKSIASSIPSENYDFSPGPGQVLFNSGPGFVNFSKAKVHALPQYEFPGWIIGPAVLVLGIVIPTAAIIPFLDSKLQPKVTDVVAPFISDALFSISAFIFFFTMHKFQASRAFVCKRAPAGLRWWNNVVLQVVGGGLPIVTLFLCSQLLTGTVATVILLPYLLILLVQLIGEVVATAKDSPVLPSLSILFQCYRLHQLNRGAAMIGQLFVSLRAVESRTPEVLAAASSLHWLWIVLQLLALIWLANLAITLTLLPQAFAEREQGLHKFEEASHTFAEHFSRTIFWDTHQLANIYDRVFPA